MKRIKNNNNKGPGVDAIAGGASVTGLAGSGWRADFVSGGVAGFKVGVVLFGVWVVLELVEWICR